MQKIRIDFAIPLLIAVAIVSLISSPAEELVHTMGLMRNDEEFVALLIQFAVGILPRYAARRNQERLRLRTHIPFRGNERLFRDFPKRCQRGMYQTAKVLKLMIFV